MSAHAGGENCSHAVRSMRRAGRHFTAARHVEHRAFRQNYLEIPFPE
jgi:hypothetical protein